MLKRLNLKNPFFYYCMVFVLFLSFENPAFAVVHPNSKAFEAVEYLKEAESFVSEISKFYSVFLSFLSMEEIKVSGINVSKKERMDFIKNFLESSSTVESIRILDSFIKNSSLSRTFFPRWPVFSSSSYGETFSTLPVLIMFLINTSEGILTIVPEEIGKEISESLLSAMAVFPCFSFEFAAPLKIRENPFWTKVKQKIEGLHPSMIWDSSNKKFVFKLFPNIDVIQNMIDKTFLNSPEVKRSTDSKSPFSDGDKKSPFSN